MTSYQLPKDDEDGAMRKMTQERFKRIFSGKGEPPPDMNIKQVEALKARVAELEAKLQEYSTNESGPFLPTSVDSAGKEVANIVDPHESRAKSTSEQASPERESTKSSFFHNLLRAPKFEDIAKTQIANLQHRILMGLFAVSWLSIALLIWTWSDTTPTSLGIVLFANALFALASFWQRRGYIERASWILVGTIYIILVFSVRDGLSYSGVIIAALVISLAGLLLRSRSVVAVIFICQTAVARPNVN